MVKKNVKLVADGPSLEVAVIAGTVGESWGDIDFKRMVEKLQGQSQEQLQPSFEPILQTIFSDALPIRPVAPASGRVFGSAAGGPVGGSAAMCQFGGSASVGFPDQLSLFGSFGGTT